MRNTSIPLSYCPIKMTEIITCKCVELVISSNYLGTKFIFCISKLGYVVWTLEHVNKMALL